MKKHLPKRIANRMKAVWAEAAERKSEIPMPWKLMFELADIGSDASEEAVEVAVEKLLSAPTEANRELHAGVVTYLKSYSSKRNEADDVAAVLLFNHICRHPAKSDLIFYGTDYFSHHPSVDEIVDLSMGSARP
jgi:hypothetical protein